MVNTPSENTVPASYLRRYEFSDGEVSALAKYAVFSPGDPDRLWTLSAHEVVVRGEEIKPPYCFSDDEPLSRMRAYYTGEETSTIVYFLDTWIDEVPFFASNYVVYELHELTHWAINDEENETGPGHWIRWNDRIATEVRWLMGLNVTEAGELSRNDTD